MNLYFQLLSYTLVYGVLKYVFLKLCASTLHP